MDFIMPRETTHPSGSRRRRWFVTGVALVLALVAVRLLLPFLVEHYVNERLQQMENYTGQVDRIHLALWRGAYTLEQLVIERRGAARNEPFLYTERLHLELQWPALVRGAAVGKARFEHAELNLVQSEERSQRQLGEGNDWWHTLSQLFPVSFNEITVTDGMVRFRAPGIPRKEALTLNNVQFFLRNLTNVFEADQRAFASFELRGQMLGKSPLVITGKLDPNASEPTFEVKAELQQVALPQLNPWLETYAGINAKAGSFALYTEVAAAEGAFKGYVKPIAKDIDVTTPKKDEDNLLRRAWTGLVELATTLFQNQAEDQLATRVPLSGNIDDPDMDILSTVINILRNAFIKAFSSSLENSVDLEDLGLQDSGSNQADKEKEKDD